MGKAGKIDRFHGTAMALLQSGVDIGVIALWLGRWHRDHDCGFARESRPERKRVGKSLAGRYAVPPLSGDRYLAFLESL
jgi:hypothetical protein